MARIGITYEQVNAIANAIVGEGARPTIESIRQRLGTGSPNTIHRHLTAWRASRPAQVEQKIELPSSILAAIAAEIERAAAAARAEIEARLVEMQAEAKDLADTGEVLETEIERLADELNKAEDALKEKSATITDQHWEIGSLKDQLKTAQESIETLRTDKAKALVCVENKTTENGELHAEIAKLKAELEEARTRNHQAEKAEAVALAKLENMTEQAKIAMAGANACNLEKERLMKELSSASNQINAQQIALDAAAREANQAKEQAKEARAEAKKAGEEAAELRGRLATTKPARKATSQKSE